MFNIQVYNKINFNLTIKIPAPISKLETTFKSKFTLNYLTLKNFKKDNRLENNTKLRYKSVVPLSLSLFRILIKVNTWIPYDRVFAHYTFSNYYYTIYYSSVGFFNVKKLFSLWTNIIHFINNIFFFKLTYLVFGNIYFKYEVLSLNWQLNNMFLKSWRYNSSFIFFLNNKSTPQTEIFFRKLQTSQQKIAFVIDVHYHKKTLHYFDKFKLVTVGPVPISSSLYTLGFSLPVTSNTVFSNLFFLRLLMKLRKLNYKQSLENYLLLYKPY